MPRWPCRRAGGFCYSCELLVVASVPLTVTGSPVTSGWSRWRVLRGGARALQPRRVGGGGQRARRRSSAQARSTATPGWGGRGEQSDGGPARAWARQPLRVGYAVGSAPASVQRAGGLDGHPGWGGCGEQSGGGPARGCGSATVPGWWQWECSAAGLARGRARQPLRTGGSGSVPRPVWRARGLGSRSGLGMRWGALRHRSSAQAGSTATRAGRAPRRQPAARARPTAAPGWLPWRVLRRRTSSPARSRRRGVPARAGPSSAGARRCCPPGAPARWRRR